MIRAAAVTLALLASTAVWAKPWLVVSLVGLLFGTVGVWLERRPGFWRWQQRVSGSILVALGLSLAVPDRR